MDRALVYGTKGCRFESCRAYHGKVLTSPGKRRQAAAIAPVSASFPPRLPDSLSWQAVASVGVPGRLRAERALARYRDRPGPPVSRSASPIAANCSRAVAGAALLGQAGPGQEKKAVRKVRASAQPFIAFDPARPADHPSACRARRRGFYVDPHKTPGYTMAWDASD